MNYELFEDLYYNCIEYFKFFNGKINKNNICKLDINSYNMLNFAEFKYPNIISIKLCTIMEFYKNKSTEDLQSFIMLTICHELVHADQSCSFLKYKKNSKFKKRIELDAETKSINYLLNNRKVILKRFSVDVMIGINMRGKPDINISNYNPICFNLFNHYIHSICSTFIQNEIKEKKILSMSVPYPNIFINIEDITEKITIKYSFYIKKDNIVLNIIDMFNNILSEYRIGNSSFKVKFSINKYSNNKLILNILILNKRYFPIAFNN